ncbi:MAG: FKBP-type peptidyl-prolyl cis-trans isomerase [Bacteroidales bacterium]|nr:FKBP-type peptidyl-prolyl cis-trans isomerase [Bacteroidales bacterium]
MKKTISKIALLLLAVAFAFNFTACSKYKGFKHDKESGIYYKFYVINKDSAQAQTGDVVSLFYQLSLKDSVLVPSMPIQEMIQESLYKGDVYSALRMMHVGDSATFILDADTFFHYMGGTNPFDEKELYFTFKMTELMPKAEVEAMMKEQEAKYQVMIEQAKAAEDSIMTQYIADNKIKVAPTASGLYYIQKVAGKGAQAENGKKVSVHYTGRLLDGTVFDSSIERGEPIEFVLGQGQVIPGWEEGIAKMKEGGKATLLIPSNLAYGERGNQVIPPCSPLVFDVELVKVGE